jgi:hypothetical protein
VWLPQERSPRGHDTAIAASARLCGAPPSRRCRHPKAGCLRSGAELVSAAPLAVEPFLELDLRNRPGRVQVDPLTPGAPDAAPPAHERQILEERWFDRQDVKSGHVPGAVDPFEHEKLKKGRVVRVRGHGPELRRNNPLASNK